jgi:hypothetical protein
MGPEEIDRLLRGYHGLACEAIERSGGTIEKFIGDAVAALFGFPLAHEDDPERAVRAALDIVERVRSDEIGVQVRVAVETGEAFVRDVSRGHGFAAGDVMNTAARLQSAAESMSVIVGPRARASAAGGFVFAEVPPLRLKGKQAPVRASLVVRPLAVSVSPARGRGRARGRGVGQSPDPRLGTRVLEPGEPSRRGRRGGCPPGRGLAAELLRVPDHLGAVTGLGALARAQLRAGHLNAAASTIAHVSAEVDKRGFRGTQITYQVEAAAEYALLGLATDNSAATRKAARRAIRGSLRRKHLARFHTVHAHMLNGGMRWVLGQEHRAERSFARAKTLAQQYQWHGTLDDAAKWVASCCAAAGLDPPALPAYALPPAGAARDLASATEA